MAKVRKQFIGKSVRDRSNFFFSDTEGCQKKPENSPFCNAKNPKNATNSDCGIIMLVLCFFKAVRRKLRNMEEYIENTGNQDGLPPDKTEGLKHCLRHRSQYIMCCFCRRSQYRP